MRTTTICSQLWLPILAVAVVGACGARSGLDERQSSGTGGSTDGGFGLGGSSGGNLGLGGSLFGSGGSNGNGGDFSCPDLCKMPEPCGPDEHLVTRAGQCCPVCVSTDPCAGVLCEGPACPPGAILQTSPGQCCPVCVILVDASVGVCAPGATECAGNGVVTCDASGQWTTGSVPCSAVTPICVDGACTSPPSCAGTGSGQTDCGTNHASSCCTSEPVAGGAFNRTYTNDGTGPSGEADPATVSDFRLDKYPVTVGRFRQFVAAWNAGWRPPAGSGKHTHLNGGKGLADSGNPGGFEPGWVASDDSRVAPTDKNLACGTPLPGVVSPTYTTWTPSPGKQEALPINCANWWESLAFCIWDGGFLPSEAESEYAAAGGAAEREYPWGGDAPGAANQYAIYDCYYPNSKPSCTGIANIAPVGTATLGAGKWGQLDQEGNLREWVLDWFAPYVDPCADCTDATPPPTNPVHVIRGASFYYAAQDLLVSTRHAQSSPGIDRNDEIAFRCGRSP